MADFHLIDRFIFVGSRWKDGFIDCVLDLRQCSVKAMTHITNLLMAVVTMLPIVRVATVAERKHSAVVCYLQRVSDMDLMKNRNFVHVILRSEIIYKCKAQVLG